MEYKLRVSKRDLKLFKDFTKTYKIQILKIKERENPRFLDVIVKNSNKVHIGFWKSYM
jgi:hypothetical protein